MGYDKTTSVIYWCYPLHGMGNNVMRYHNHDWWAGLERHKRLVSNPVNRIMDILFYLGVVFVVVGSIMGWL